MIKIDQDSKLSIIALIIVTTIFVFIVYSVFANPYGRVAALALPTLLFAYAFIKCYGDYLPLVPRGKQVNFDSGIAGTLRGSLQHHPGGRVTGKVSIENSLVPAKTIAERRVGGIHKLIDWMTMGNVTIYLTGEAWQWIDIPSNHSDNPNGAIRFIGNIDGEVLPDAREMPLYTQLKNLQTINKYTLSSMEWIEHQVANLSAQKLMDMDSASQMLKEIGDRVKNVRLVAGKRGASGSEDAVISEMSS